MVDHLLDRLPLVDQVHQGHLCAVPRRGLLGDEWTQRATGVYVPSLVEPCVGQGNITNAIRARYPDVLAFRNDLDVRWDADSHRDATDQAFWQYVGFPDWVITNPPFSTAFEIVREALKVAQVGVAMLLRVTWLEPLRSAEKQAKTKWLVENPPDWELVLERTSFDGSGGQDSAPCAWFVWCPALTPRIEVIPGRGRQPTLL